MALLRLPNMMLNALLWLLALLHLRGISASSSIEWSTVCGSDRLTYSKFYRRHEISFAINGNSVDNTRFCEAVLLHKAEGCILEESFEYDLCTLHDLLGRRMLQERFEEESTKHGAEFVSHPLKASMAAGGFLLFCCAIVCPCFNKERKSKTHEVLPKDLNPGDNPSFEMSPSTEIVPPSPFRVPQSPSRYAMSPRPYRIGPLNLDMSQIVKATNNFSETHQIGEGGFGIVYKGFLDDGQVIAIKRAKKEHFENLRTEFKSEVDLLYKIEHWNLVKLLGYVDKGKERLIITEYVGNGTLRDHLDGARGKILDFSQRLEIAIDVCHGLTYLHHFAEKQIIHRDVKSSNILLTENMRAKVADFGFARGGPSEPNQTHIVTKVKGTVGYLDPEYMRTYQLTPKSDVFSFGILLVEILTGRRPVEAKRPIEERITVRWAFNKYQEGKVNELVDPNLGEHVNEKLMRKMFSLAFNCTAPTRNDRPDMKAVGEQLWNIRSKYLKLSKG